MKDDEEKDQASIGRLVHDAIDALMTIHQSPKGRYPRRHVVPKLNKVLYLLLLAFILVTTPVEGRSYFFNRPSSSSPIDDPYVVLGLRRHASAEEIKTAYRAKVCTILSVMNTSG